MLQWSMVELPSLATARLALSTSTLTAAPLSAMLTLQPSAARGARWRKAASPGVMKQLAASTNTTNLVPPGSAAGTAELGEGHYYSCSFSVAMGQYLRMPAARCCRGLTELWLQANPSRRLKPRARPAREPG